MGCVLFRQVVHRGRNTCNETVMSLIDAREPINPAPANALREVVAELVSEDLNAAMRVYDSELGSANPALVDILRHTSRFRGKQLRPTLLLLVAKATGGVRESHHVLAAVIEMIHVATLLHDDVLDEAEVRRHLATVNHRWNNETSVLFGDYLFTHAFHLAASLESTDACRRIGGATNRLCEGELTQISHRGNLDLDESAYFDIIDGKTAELCAVAAELGAIYSGADSTIVAACEQYGRKVGLAFQIADDLLDLVGASDQTGKTLGTDLEKQKLTLPLIHMLNALSPEDANAARALLAQPDMSTREALEPFLRETGAMDYARKRAGQLASEAKQCLASFQDTRAKAILLQMADQAADRQR